MKLPPVCARIAGFPNVPFQLNEPLCVASSIWIAWSPGERGNTNQVQFSGEGSLAAPNWPTLLVLTAVDGELRIKPFHLNKHPTPSEEGSPGLRELYEYFAPVREEIRASGITQEALFADIDAAIEEVRAERRARRERHTCRG